jgi:hypothetical protein
MGDAIQDDGGGQLSQNGVYAGGSEEFAGGSGGEKFADAFSFKKWAVFARVLDTVLGVVNGTGLAATAATREGKVAKVGFLEGMPVVRGVDLQRNGTTRYDYFM